MEQTGNIEFSSEYGVPSAIETNINVDKTDTVIKINDPSICLNSSLIKSQKPNSLSNNDLSNDTSSPLKKRGRGRSKKSVNLDSSDFSDSLNSLLKYSIIEKEHLNSSSKGKKKDTTTSLCGFQNDNLDEGINSTGSCKKRGHGRPKKSMLEISCDISETENITPEGSSLTSDSTEAIENDKDLLTSVLKKKRGRPRKDSSEDIKQDGKKIKIDDSDLSLLNAEQTKIPKKRGRPKKSELELEKSFNVKSKPEVFSTSAKGRKRKQINYSLLDDGDDYNPNISGDSAEDQSGFSSDDSCSTDVNVLDEKSANRTATKRGRPRKSKVIGSKPSKTKKESYTSSEDSSEDEKYSKDAELDKSRLNESALDHSISDSKIVRKPLRIKKIISSSDDSSSDDKALSDIVNKDNKVAKDNKNDIKSTEVTESTENDKCDVINELQENDCKTKRYKWTGRLNTAVTQLFNSFQGKDMDEVSVDSTRGRKKREMRRSNIALDEDGTSFCMVCNVDIDNKNWLTHMRKVHNNLTWKRGSMPIDVSNPSVIQKTYAKLIKEQGYLKCQTCSKKVTSVKKFMEHLDICNGVVINGDNVACAVCKQEMLKSGWQYHKYKEHNNLAWREGDPPLNLQDQDLVVRILTQLYKQKKPLHCEKCKLQKKSVMGYLSHRSVCQAGGNPENVKVMCKLCGRTVLPVSMDYHMKLHNKPAVNSNTIEKSGYFDMDLSNGGPRRAARQALQVIKSIKGECLGSSKYYVVQCDFEEDFVITELKKKLTETSDLACIFNECEFNSPAIDVMVKHLKECDKKPEQYFLCKLCLTWCKEETDIKDHIKEVHKKTQDENDAEFDESEVLDSDDDKYMDMMDEEKTRLRKLSKICVMQNNCAKPLFLVYPIRDNSRNLVYPQSDYWMKSFCEKYYASTHLFNCCRNSTAWQVLDCDILNDYLPMHHDSCDVTVKAVTLNEGIGDLQQLEYKKFELFETASYYKGETTIFCGGPISAMAWLPTPFGHESYKQILAVSIFNEPEREYYVGETYHEPYIIQFYSFGQLNKQQKSDITASLLYGLAITTGPIWHLEFCPSGCFDLSEGENALRMGLLAVAASDSFVYIYSVDDLKDDSDRGLIYKGEPVMKLQLENGENTLGLPYYATRISWTKAAGHRYIAVGYSSGIIGLFDLLTKSSLYQRRDQSGIQVILPYQMIQAHSSCITALSLGHLNGGNRWMFSAGLDRNTIYWDLSNLTKTMRIKRYGVADGVGPILWPAIILAEDDSTFNESGIAHTFMKIVRDVFNIEFTSFTNSIAGIKSVSFGDWLNLILHGGNAGEIKCLFAHRLFFKMDKKVSRKNFTQCLLSVTKLLSKGPSANSVSHCPTFETASENYGIVFMDYESDNLSKIPNTKKHILVSDEIQKCNTHDYPLQSVNKVAINPNQQASSFFASGYQAGFVRVRQINFLNDTFKPGMVDGYSFSDSL